MRLPSWKFSLLKSHLHSSCFNNAPFSFKRRQSRRILLDCLWFKLLRYFYHFHVKPCSFMPQSFVPASCERGSNFTCGFDEKQKRYVILRFSQFFPVYPVGQRQSYPGPVTFSRHSPLFRHGRRAHSLISEGKL